MPVLVGTRGWQYADWRSRFYPPGLPQRRWYEHTMAAFRTVELNVTVYGCRSGRSSTAGGSAAPTTPC